MTQPPQQNQKTVTPLLLDQDQDDFDFITPQIDLLQSAFHLLFAAITTRSSLHDMLAVSRVLSYTADQYSRLHNAANSPPLPEAVPLLDWEGIFERIWTLDLEHPAPFLPR